MPWLVNVASPLFLLINVAPVSFSNALIFWLTAGWDMPRCLEAFVKLPVFATVMKTLSLKSSNIMFQ